MNQRGLFIEWENACNRLNCLKEIIQNDFTLMLEDGYTTKKDIKDSIYEFKTLYVNRIKDMNVLKNKIVKLMEKASE
jgi:hypothetical protein